LDHILPGIDDGARNAKESLRMAKIAAADGVKKIVATPHVKETIHSAGFLKKCVAKLNEVLKERSDTCLLIFCMALMHMPCCLRKI
jgi:protein-tyrosine phosphatase